MPCGRVITSGAPHRLPWLHVQWVPLVSAALATALDVGLSNWSFLYITVSL